MKNILIYLPECIAPLIMANRVRVMEKIKILSVNHSVTFLSIISGPEEREETLQLLNGYCRCEFIVRPPKKSIYGFFLRVKWVLLDFLGVLPYEYSLANGKWIQKAIKRISSELNIFDSVICDYWYSAKSTFFYFKNKNTIKIVDTHNVLSEQRVLEIEKTPKMLFSAKWLRSYHDLERSNLQEADVLIAISLNDYHYYVANYPGIKIALIPIGIDLRRINDVTVEAKNNEVLFFANLASQQNIIAFNRLWKSIFPVIRSKVPDARLLIVGSNPGQEILKLNDLDYVTVTGFVEDPLMYARQAKVHIIAMETASGFRGRIPEVMGIGVPTIGTHNALDCMGFDGELAEYISDNDDDLAMTAIRLMKEKEFWCRISQQSRKFIFENYSLQKTYSKLENYI